MNKSIKKDNFLKYLGNWKSCYALRKSFAQEIKKNIVTPLYFYPSSHAAFVAHMKTVYSLCFIVMTVHCIVFKAGKHDVIVKNIHDLLAKLAWDFSAEQLDHLFECFQVSL